MSESPRVRTFGAVEVEAFSGPPGLHVPRHGHAGVHFTLVRAGGFDEVLGRRRHLQEGDLRVSPCGDEHELRFGPAGASCLIVSVPDSWPAGASGSGVPRDRKDAPHPLTRVWAAGLTAEAEAPGPESPLVVEGIALELVRWSSRAGEEGQNPMPSWLRELRDELHDTGGLGRSLEEIGRRVGRHPVYVARAFRVQFGRSIGVYARDLRLARAARLTRRTAQPLADIANECGFSDQAHFTRWMKSRMGLTPGEMRREGLGPNAVKVRGVQDRRRAVR